ncbi:transglutaminase family protein [uncultured Phenylobacterium sp.]|uniref:transglutaminase-like domain-containing protein n=1 Tax=uncultured Phenylobacterium sp. TaxID=349273 RepID=UPI0025D499BF|nr:transglutaminase family protein [uncultured Phenylobacterium sp.]
MRIRAGYKITYDCPAPTPMLLMLNVRPERLADLETPDLIHTTPHVPLRQYRDQFGNLCARILAPAGRMVLSGDFVIRDSGQPDPVFPDAKQLPIDELPDDVIVFLLGSRYCETQALNELAWRLFGGIEPGWARAAAIVKYAHERITFGYKHARPTRTAFEAHEEQLGVCRDYAHLAITLCRCMNIPARYCTGYLGDIGVPKDGLMDFSAWMEVYLGGQWLTLDARHNKPRIGRIMMAVGRDATDVALVTHFGPATLAGFEVVTDELPEQLARVG